MKHHKKGRTLGREKKQRVALLRSLSISLIEKEKINTTEARAKELRPYIERLITLAKNNSLHGKRIVLSRLGNARKTEEKLFSVIAPRFKSRSGGYTRIIKLPRRIKDASKMAVIEFVS